MRKEKFTLILVAILALSLSLTGCNLPGDTTPTTQVDLLNTAAAQTIQAQQTFIAQTQQASQTAAAPTNTLEVTAEIGTPTFSPQPSLTPTITATKTAEKECDQAAFISETIPDGTEFFPGQPFTKTWTLENSGSCTWNANYDVVFVSGDAMGAPASQQLTSDTVAPGETVKITMDLIAPMTPGTHRGDFKLRNASGVLFGIGAKDGPFWVEIDVNESSYEFAKIYCVSGVTWTSGAGTLPCPGDPGDDEGWVKRFNEPTLETGKVENEPGLAVHPQNVTDGWIKGTFPEITLTEDMFFKAILSCNEDANCNVNFKLNYKIDGGAENTLGTWHEVKDDNFNSISVDLSSLTGESVQFILLVEANGSPANDAALWVAPRIEP
jgi:hypothetical protein